MCEPLLPTRNTGLGLTRRGDVTLLRTLAQGPPSPRGRSRSGRERRDRLGRPPATGLHPPGVRLQKIPKVRSHRGGCISIPAKQRYKRFTFARCGRTSRGAPSPRSRALIHISPSCGCTQWVAPRAQIAQPRSGRAIRVVEREPRLALSTWRRHRMLSE